MKKLYLLMLLNAAFIDIYAQNFSWAKREGLYAYDYGYGITNDNNGNVYVTGKYEQNANFSGTILPCRDNHDIFLAQYNPAGELNWITTAGGHLGDYAEGVACDNNFVYIAGEIEGPKDTIYFQNSPAILLTYAENDAFVAKYDLSGKLIWAKKAGWYQNDKALSVAVDPSGNVFISGFFNDTISFDGGASFLFGRGLNDIYVAKYDANGNFLWARTAGSPGRDEAKGIKCDSSGNVYVTGMYSDQCVFGSQTLSSPNGYYNVFLAKYDPSGNLAWVNTAGDNYDDVSWGITIDKNNRIFIAGEFVGYVSFGGTPALTTSGGTDIFVACYDAGGTAIWAKQAGGIGTDRARGIGTDGSRIYITGQFGNTASFAWHSITAVDSSDIYMAALDNNGDYLWATAAGGPADDPEPLGYECGNAICALNGNVYATGSLLSGGVFGSTTLQNYGRTDVFVAKILDVTTDGVNDRSLADAQFSVYPNPSRGLVNLVSENAKVRKVEVFNVTGEKIYAASADLMPRIVSLDLSSYPAGVYFLEINGTGWTRREKIVLQ